MKTNSCSRKVSLLTLDGSQEAKSLLTPLRTLLQRKPIDRGVLNVEEDINEEQVDVLLKMLNEYGDCFALTLSELGLCN